jgi:hypothetical protein
MKSYKKKRKTYYVTLNKETNDILISTTKAKIVDFVNISVDSIRRHLVNSSIYNTKEFTIWSDVSIKKSKKGFAL